MNREGLAGCTACPLASTRIQVVIPDGPDDAPIVIVGEAPGEEEDKGGSPFIGRSGKKLDWLLARGGLNRENMLLTNTVMCRPPGNRNPTAVEIKACRPHLDTVLGEFPRKAVLALGDKALKTLAGKKATLKRLHGRHIEGTNIIPLYHPAAALHNPNLTPTLITDYRRLPVELVRIPVTRGEHQSVKEADLLHKELGSHFAFDLETSWVKDRVGDVSVVGYSVAYPNLDHAFFVRGEPTTTLFESRGGQVVAHNAQFEYQILKEYGLCWDEVFDTKLAAYLLGYSDTSLKGLALQVFGCNMRTLEELSDGFKVPVEDIPDEQLADYGADDAFWTLKLKGVLEAELEEAGLTKLYRELELPVIPVLGDMVSVGIEIDKGALQVADNKLSELIVAREIGLRKVLGDINLNSGDQLAEVLFDKDKLDYPVINMTKGGGRPSTDKTVLEILAQLYPIAQEILDYRHIVKLKNTYVEGIRERIGERTRLYAHFNQAGGFEEKAGVNPTEAPRTGRLSSSGPNLTNIPKHDAPGLSKVAPYIRRCFVSHPGYSLVVGDLSQEEFRVAAYLSGDPAMLDIIHNNRDWHAATAMAAFGRRNVSELIGEERYYGKQSNFAKLNGAGVATIAHTCKVQRGVAQQLSDSFDHLHERYQEWREEQAEAITDTGYAYTYYGRRRYLPAVWAGDEGMRVEAIRQGINVPIQGTAADILKLALRRMWERLQGHDAHLVSCVHDELIIEALDKEVEFVIQCFDGLTEGLLGSMPLPINVQVGRNWSEWSEWNLEGLKEV